MTLVILTRVIAPPSPAMLRRMVRSATLGKLHDSLRELRGDLRHRCPTSNSLRFDAEDLGVISAHLQDAVLRVGDMVYLPDEKRFVAHRQSFRLGESKGAAANVAEDISR